MEDQPKPDSQSDDRIGKSTTMFKMPMSKTIQAVSKNDTVKLFESEPETAPSLTLPSGKVDDEETTETAPSVIETKKSKKEAFSPAERLKESESPIPYKEPSWGGRSEHKYFFEAVKNGTVVEKVELSSKSWYVFGRLPSCDHTMDHPSLSRYHAVVQHRSVEDNGESVGWYLYDLDSTHGTWINKHKVKPRVYFRLKVGYVVKFGGSTRLYVLHGPDSDQDEESQLSVAELKAQRERQKKEAEVLRNVEIMEAEEARRKRLEAEEDKGCSWGIDMDDPAVEEEDEEINPFSVPEPLNEALYLDDPKKSLRGFFEREGYELPEYEITDEGKGRHRCRVELPIETISGEPETVEVVQEGKKKDVVVACALEACRLLDRRGLLRQGKHESRAKKRKNWEDADFYDSDDDTFLDRTGTVEKKREMRMRKVKKAEKLENYETLSAKLNEVTAEMETTEQKLEKDKLDKQAAIDDGLDELDAFMLSMKSGGLDTKTKISLKHRLVELRQQKLHLERLLAVARPCQVSLATNSDRSENPKNKPLMFGKMKGINKHGGQRVQPSKSLPSDNKDEDNEFEEEEEEEEEEEVEIGKEKAVTRSQIEPSVCLDTKQVTENSSNTKADRSDNTTDKSRSKTLNDVAEDVSTKTLGGSKVDELSVNTSPVKKVKAVEPQKRPKKFEELKSKVPKRSKEVLPRSYDETDSDYAMWLPPPAQSGDGKTSLNERFGY